MQSQRRKGWKEWDGMGWDRAYECIAGIVDSPQLAAGKSAPDEEPPPEVAEKQGRMDYVFAVETC